MNSSLSGRIVRYYRRNASRFVSQKRVPVRLKQPLISFTFDDFPRTALLSGGRILDEFGVRGTYYVALGLIDGDSPSGPICSAEDLKAALDAGHELGCHTFTHCQSWDTNPEEFESSVVRNAAALDELIPGAKFRSFSYPICAPRPATKRRTSRHFECCREGGQTLNSGTADLNQLSAFFLERSRDDLGPIKALIDRNARQRGWIIFATHDIDQNPSPYGCKPEFFRDVVRYAVDSGATVVPVAQALDILRGESAGERVGAPGVKNLGSPCPD